MGLLDFLIGVFRGGSKVQCPSCGTQGAQKSHEGLIHCKNPVCPYFDASLGTSGTLRKAGSTVPTRGDSRPEHPLSIRYRNFAGQERTFITERESVVRKNNHLVGRVVPTGHKITLCRDRIQNLSEVEEALPQRVSPGQTWPTPRERQILGYHRKHGTSSARYEQIRAKYPKW